MKNTTTKMNIYASLFLVRSLLFNATLALAITALVFVRDGMTSYAIASIALAGSWVASDLLTHLTWYKMKVQERALYIAIRRHGKGMVHLTKGELKKTGQADIKEFFHDIDSGLEVQMLVNGTGTFINTFIGIKWFMAAKHFNNHEGTFTYAIEEK